MKEIDIYERLSAYYDNQKSGKYKIFHQVRTGSTWMKKVFVLDAVAFKMSYSTPEIIGFEIKVTKADFNGDKKWQHYTRYVNKLVFVCPKGIIKPSDLPDKIGLISIEDDMSLKWSKKPKIINANPDKDIYQYMCYSRLDSCVCPFHKEKWKKEHKQAKIELEQSEIELQLKEKNFNLYMFSRIAPELEEKIKKYRDAENDAEKQIGELQKLKNLFDSLIKQFNPTWHEKREYSGDPCSLLKQLISEWINIDKSVLIVENELECAKKEVIKKEQEVKKMIRFKEIIKDI